MSVFFGHIRLFIGKSNIVNYWPFLSFTQLYPPSLKTYKKVDLLIVDEWLIRCLTPQESTSQKSNDSAGNHGGPLWATA